MECIYTCDSCGFKCQTIKSFDFHIVTEHLPYQIDNINKIFTLEKEVNYSPTFTNQNQEQNAQKVKTKQ